jgi:Transposase, Mutator family
MRWSRPPQHARQRYGYRTTPLLGERHLSKSAVSRIVTRLKALFTTWQTRDLRGERYAVVFLDGFHFKVRLARRVVAVPVLAALGVMENGQKRLFMLQLAATEAATSRESQSRIPASDQDPSVVRYRDRGDHVALWLGRVRSDRVASNRRSRTIGRVPREGVDCGCVRNRSTTMVSVI